MLMKGQIPLFFPQDDKFRLLDTETVSTGVKNFIENLFIVNFVIKTIAGIWDGVRQKLKVRFSLTTAYENLKTVCKKISEEFCEELTANRLYPRSLYWSSTPTRAGPVSRKSRNFTGHFRVSQFPLYLKNGEDSSR